MTVHFKGISEYQNKYKVRHRRSRSASPHRRMRLAGLRSDQLGISREPQFQTKRRVPLYPPQASSSLQWKGSSGSSRQQDITKSGTHPMGPVVPVVQTGSKENVETPLAPRSSKPPRVSRAYQPQEEVPSAQTEGPSANQQKQGAPSNFVSQVLRRKPDLKSQCQRNGGWDSEYHRQFHWKTPVAESPLLTAQQMLYTSNGKIPPFRAEPAVMETEYIRSFKGSPPAKPPRLRRDVEPNALPPPQMETPSPDKSKEKKNLKEQQHLSKTLSPNEKVLPPQPRLVQQKVSSPRAQNDTSPKATRYCRKAKTEYTSNFRSPLQYCYREGAWVKCAIPGDEVHQWYHEVRELREKAEAYRKRSWGTHFSRQHLSQILSAQNVLWEASSYSSSSSLSEEENHSTNSPTVEALDLARMESDRGNSSRGTSVTLTTSRQSSAERAGAFKSPTLPVLRKLAWEEEAGPFERGVAQITQERKGPPFQTPMETEEKGGIHGNSEDKRHEVTVPECESVSAEVLSAHLSEEGRVPTPKLKTMLSIQRTHHDRTTPTTGGAVLVSPPKTNYTRRTRRSEAPLGKSHSANRPLTHGSPPPAHSRADGGSLPHSALTAGLATADPLPLNEDSWAADGPTASLEPKAVRATSALLSTASSPHGNRIQGMLRNPEFQHNGNLGLHRSETFLFPSSDSAVSDNDDRMSQISGRSAASCLVASRVLDRAQRRKEEFWGKG